MGVRQPTGQNAEEDKKEMSRSQKHTHLSLINEKEWSLVNILSVALHTFSIIGSFSVQSHHQSCNKSK